MFVFMVFVVLLVGNCEAQRHHNRKNAEFYIKIETIGTKDRPVICSKTYCPYIFVIGYTLEFTCGPGTVTWTDDYDFETSLRDGGRLQITPDEEDINLNLTCNGHNNNGGQEKITVKLVVHDASKIQEVSEPGEVLYLNVGDSWTSSNCFGISYYPKPLITIGTQYDYDRVLWPHDTHKVITSFNESLNGSIFYCIDFMRVPPTHSHELRSQRVTKKRVKIKFTFYLNPAEESTERREVSRQTQSGIIKSGPQTNISAIVGGVLGAIMFVLLAVLLGIWYKTTRQRLRLANADGATRVIYAELEERQTAPQPPPRNPIPYAKIIGTLMPTQQAQHKGDPHSVTCPVKSDPHYVTCQEYI